MKKIYGNRIFLGTLAAFAVAIFCSYFSRIEFLIALGSLLFSWPIADYIIDELAAKNIRPGEGIYETEWWIPVLQLSIIFGCAVAGVLGAKLKFLEALSITIVCLCPLGAFLGILAEWEDNEPGGFNNPSPTKDDSQSNSNDEDSEKK